MSITKQQRATIKGIEGQQVGFPILYEESGGVVRWVGIESFSGGTHVPDSLTMFVAWIAPNGTILREESRDYTRDT